MEEGYGRGDGNFKEDGYMDFEGSPKGSECDRMQMGICEEKRQNGKHHPKKGKTCSSRVQSKTDYNNDGTFTPVMRFETLRTVLAYAAVNNLKLRQFDVKGAYLHGYLNETIYMNQPPGFEDDTGRACLLERSLYGLKQAGNVWNQELN